jgi:OmpA-OmpF porin, OOP family
MRGFLNALAVVPLAALALAVPAGGAAAQQSADQIISALKPGGDMTRGATRGIRLGGTHPAPAAAGRVLTPAGVAGTVAPRTSERIVVPAPVSGPSVNLTVNFPSGSADLTPAARASLDALGKALSSPDLATYRFRIEGHTDNVGARYANLVLSRDRAKAVVDYLTEQYHVRRDRLVAVGMGQEDPLVPTPPQTPEARNRRVQVINLGS